MRRLVLVTMLILALALATMAFAQPPDSDPTCDHGNPRFECPGDNGAPGCRGIEEADDHNPEQSDDAMDLVTDILSEDDEGDCSNGNG